MHRSVNSANKSIYDDVPLPSELYNIENAGPIESTIEPNLSENNFWFSGFERCSMSTHYCAINSGPVESPMEPNFSENNFRSSGFEMHQPINSYEANERNERKLSSEPFPSHVEKGRVAEIDQHCKKLGENTSAPSLPSLYASSPNAFEVFGSSTDKSAIPYNVFPANVNRPTFLSQQSENYTMRAPPRPSGTGVRFHEDREHDNVPSIAENSTLSLSDRIRKLSDSTHYEAVQLKPNIPYEMRSNFEIVDNINDSPSFNLTEIEREPVVTDGSSGCKRCNCKKSRCLKLYCQCFSLGVYCSDSCACQDCSNKTEYKEIVLQAVQMIKSRNPLAFTPKISGTSANNSGEDGGIHHTVASARHRRGCNCKKSKCLKKYCECYQSGVGCCDRCRCEGCQNVHGQKGVYIMNKNLVSNHDSNKILSDSYNEIANDNLLHDQFGDPYPYQMTLSTPSIPFSNHGETAQNSWVPPHMPFRPSYESSSDANIIEVPYHQSSPEMVTNNENYNNNGIRPQVPFNGQLPYYGSQNTTMSSFSPGFGVPALDHPLNSANNSVNSMIQSEGTRFLEGDNSNSAIVNSLIQSERTRFLEGDNSNSTNNSVNSLIQSERTRFLEGDNSNSAIVNSMIQSERTRFLEGDNLNSTNNSVNSLIQSKRTKFLEGDSCFRRFSSTFKDGIPQEESAPLLQVVNPPPNKIQVSPPFGIRSAIGLKLNLSRFNPCNDKENNNPNDQQNYSRQDDDGQY